MDALSYSGFPPSSIAVALVESVFFLSDCVAQQVQNGTQVLCCSATIVGV